MNMRSFILRNLMLPVLATVSFTAFAQAQLTHTSHVVGKAQLPVHKRVNVEKIAKNNPQFRSEFDAAYADRHRPLMYNWGGEEYRKLSILIREDKLNTPQLREFRDALVQFKRPLMRLYKLRNETYNKLAAMALGIYGNETEFGSSFRFSLKERNQLLVRTMKYLTGKSGVASRGGTQIKLIPKKIKEEYSEITPESLVLPTNAAIALRRFAHLKKLRSVESGQTLVTFETK